MDKTFVEAISQLSNMDVSAIEETFVPVAIAPAECRVHSLEKYMERPLRTRAAFTTERLDDFCAYVKKERTDRTIVTVEPDGLAARAIFDAGGDGEPDWGDHTARAALPNTPEYDALLGLCRSTLTQRDLIEFFEDWGGILSAETSSGEDLPIARAISHVRSVTISQLKGVTNEEADFEAAKSILDRVSASGKDNAELPAILRATCPPLTELEPYQFELRLSLSTHDDKPAFRVRMVQKGLIQKKITQDIQALIKKELNDITVYVGNLSLGSP